MRQGRSESILVYFLFFLLLFVLAFLYSQSSDLEVSIKRVYLDMIEYYISFHT